MATIGRLGAEDIDGSTNAIDTDIAVYTVPASTKTSCNISICNRNASAVAVRLSFIDGAIGALAAADYLEYDVEIPANGVLERTAVSMQATYTIGFRSDTTNVNCVIWGIEEAV